MYEVFSELIRGYQFRDKNTSCVCGVSVTQCNTLEVLEIRGSSTMGELAAQMYLDVSTMTRVVDQLVVRGFAERNEDSRDRRIRRITITNNGREVHDTIRQGIEKEYREVLGSIEPESREAVIAALGLMLKSFKAR